MSAAAVNPQPAPACRYYGCSSQIFKRSGELINISDLAFPRLHSNECAAVADRYAPCKMERFGRSPDEQVCPIARSANRRRDECS